MGNTSCVSCQKSNAGLICGLCQQAVCKKCAQFVPEDQFSFLKQIPDDLKHGTYCSSCFDQTVSPEIATYEQNMEKAKEIIVFFKTQTKETRLMKRTEKPIKVSDCSDRDETLLRLAFFAAQGGFNGIIDVELTSEKVRSGGSYQTHKWSGVAIPAQVDESRIPKDRSIWQNPN